MSGALPSGMPGGMTKDAFLDWERGQDLRYEFDGVRAVAMTGGSVAHSMIATNLVRALQDRLRGGPCQAFRGDLKIEVAGRVRYPDAMVTCSAVRPADDIVPDPVVVFEVISCFTDGVDRIVKNEEYRSTGSIRRYVMLEQDWVAATVFARSGDDWVGHVVADATVLALPELGIDVPFGEIYAGVEMAGEDVGG